MLAAMASVALASCVKNEPVATVEQGDLITFNSPVVAPATKAATGSVKYTDDGFSVYAWYHTAVFANNGTPYMVDVPITSTTTDEATVWSNASYYWPKNGYLTFFAYSPTVLPDGSSVAATGTSVAVTYKVPAAADSQVDLLYSDWAKDQTKDKYVTQSGLGDWTGVDIAFHHALSAVNFSFKTTANANGKFKVKTVTLTGANDSGVLTCNSSAVKGEWGSLNGTSSSYSVAADLSESALSTEAVPGDAELKLLPQTLGNDVKVTISYFILNPSEADEWIEQSMTVQLNEITEGWEMGTRYTYTLVFDVDVIQFAPVVVEDWATGAIPETEVPLAPAA